MMMRKSLTTLAFVSTFAVNIGCEVLDPKVDTMEIMVSLDQSSSFPRNCIPSSDELYSYVLKVAHLDEDSQYFGDGIKCYFSYIGHDNRPRISSITLDPGSSAAFDNLNKRARKVERFKRRLKEQIEALLTNEDRHELTLFANALAYQSEIMNEDPFSKDHTVIVISDGIEEGLMDFTTLDENAADEQWITDTSNTMSQKQPLDHCTGFNITFLTCPSTISIKNMELAMRFWEFHLDRHQAQTKFRSSLKTIEL